MFISPFNKTCGHGNELKKFDPEQPGDGIPQEKTFIFRPGSDVDKETGYLLAGRLRSFVEQLEKLPPFPNTICVLYTLPDMDTQCMELKEQTACECATSAMVFGAMGRLHLRQLWLVGVRLTPVELDAIAQQCSQLEVLVLPSCGLSDPDALLPLVNLPNLKRLDLDVTTFCQGSTDADVAQRSALSGVLRQFLEGPAPPPHGFAGVNPGERYMVLWYRGGEANLEQGVLRYIVDGDVHWMDDLYDIIYELGSPDLRGCVRSGCSYLVGGQRYFHILPQRDGGGFKSIDAQGGCA